MLNAPPTANSRRAKTGWIRRFFPITLCCFLAALVGPAPPAGKAHSAPAQVPPSRGGRDVVGKPAPAWGELAWLNPKPLSLADLRGKVVLIRFWTDTCPFCEATAPALRQLDADFAPRGLVVIGMYHPKPLGTRRPPAEVARTVRAWDWRFPVGIDTEWKTLRALWLDTGRRSATSASFLLDGRGVVRFVHPGPEFHPAGPPDHAQCREDYRSVRQAIEALLAESGRA